MTMSTDTTENLASGRSFLVVDDNDLNCELMVEILDCLGFDASIACDGTEAVAAFSQHRYDVVFMDCQMPRMDGFEATRRIRELERQHAAARTPVVAVTANAMAGDRERCLAAGMDDYAPKPITLEDIRQMLDKWMDLGASVDVNASEGIDESDAALLDGPVVAHLRKLQRPGQPDLLVTLANTYRRSAQAQIEKMVGESDLDQFRKQVKVLGQSSKRAGAAAVASALELIGKRSSDESLTSLQSGLDELVRLVQRTAEALEAEARD